MLKTRIIPCLDVKDGRVVKGINFLDLSDAGDPVEQAKIYNDQGADEICFLDITASSEKRKTIYDIVSKVAEHCFVPLTVGGGVNSIEDIRSLLRAGADKVSINTGAVKNPELIKQAAEKFGSQCIVVAIDAKRVDGDFRVFVNGGKKATDLYAEKWALRMQEYGAGEFLVTSMDRDGTKKGFDIELTKAISDIVYRPVIASGGVGKKEDFIEIIKEDSSLGLLAASVFHFGITSIKEVKKMMKEENIPVRL